MRQLQDCVLALKTNKDYFFTHIEIDFSKKIIQK